MKILGLLMSAQYLNAYHVNKGNLRQTFVCNKSEISLTQSEIIDEPHFLRHQTEEVNMIWSSKTPIYTGRMPHFLSGNSQLPVQRQNQNWIQYFNTMRISKNQTMTALYPISTITSRIFISFFFRFLCIVHTELDCCL